MSTTSFVPLTLAIVGVGGRIALGPIHASVSWLARGESKSLRAPGLAARSRVLLQRPLGIRREPRCGSPGSLRLASGCKQPSLVARGDPGPPPCSPLSQAVMRRAFARHPPALTFGSCGTPYATKVATEGNTAKTKVLEFRECPGGNRVCLGWRPTCDRVATRRIKTIKINMKSD